MTRSNFPIQKEKLETIYEDGRDGSTFSLSHPLSALPDHLAMMDIRQNDPNVSVSNNRYYYPAEAAQLYQQGQQHQWNTHRTTSNTQESFYPDLSTVAGLYPTSSSAQQAFYNGGVAPNALATTTATGFYYSSADPSSHILPLSSHWQNQNAIHPQQSQQQQHQLYPYPSHLGPTQSSSNTVDDSWKTYLNHNHYHHHARQ